MYTPPYRGDPRVYEILHLLNIPFRYHEHPPVPTVAEASKYWAGINSAHCKNLFFRNHKGNKHYLVILEYTKKLDIGALEQCLKQGKLTFASPKRLKKYLNLEPGSVSPFGLIHDTSNHVKVFIDPSLTETERISFHPNLNTASLIIPTADFLRYLEYIGNPYEILPY